MEKSRFRNWNYKYVFVFFRFTIKIEKLLELFWVSWSIVEFYTIKYWRNIYICELWFSKKYFPLNSNSLFLYSIEIRISFSRCYNSVQLDFGSTVQAWIRGILTRNHLRLLHESALIIQRHWRGYCARIIFEQCLIQSVHQMWEEYYKKMATKIQAFWRGYWLRKTLLDIKKMHCWLNEVYEKNEETVKSMKRFLIKILFVFLPLLNFILYSRNKHLFPRFFF